MVGSYLVPWCIHIIQCSLSSLPSRILARGCHRRSSFSLLSPLYRPCVFTESVWLWLIAGVSGDGRDVLPPLSLFVFQSKYSLSDLCRVHSRPTLTEWLMDYSYTHLNLLLLLHLLPPPLKNNDAEGLNWRLLIIIHHSLGRHGLLPPGSLDNYKVHWEMKNFHCWLLFQI